MEVLEPDKKPRVIKTARSKDSINEAAHNGFFPLMKSVIPSKDLRAKYAVIQNKTTGEIRVTGDYRTSDAKENETLAIEFTYYYPYHFKEPYAAYLLPKDLIVGERVWLEDVIEDIVGKRWNQGNTYRLESVEAIWNGKDFDIQHFLSEHEWEMIG
ncbi:MAG: hypothetical protein ABI763_05930 [Bacteroidota bacterium]